MNLPSEDSIANFLMKVLPSTWAHHISRWKNILISVWFYQACRRWPDGIANFLKNLIKKSLKDKYVDKHFTPKYAPWDQRLCLVPDYDMFRAITKGKAHIVTDTIKHFTEGGIELDAGDKLDADIIVTATGLKVQLFGGMNIEIDGKPLHMPDSPAFKGVMLSDVPNFALALGYTNASWTLKSDLNCRYFTKVLNLMEQKNYNVCIPRFPHETMEKQRLLDFDANYILRANDILPKQGTSGPWKVEQNYLKDLMALGYGSPKDKYLEYS
jgi:cation diffusion facilitator CzcD-associated flavoprotein CzcO